MPLTAKVPPGREHFYLRGTVRAGKKSRSVYESTGIGQGLPGAAAKVEEIRLRREGEIYHELLYGPKTVVTFTQAAAAYCEDRNRQRLIANPALAGRPDPEALYVAKWIKFLRGRGVADIPLEDFITDERQRRKAAKDGRTTSHLKAYFDALHVAKGNKLSTMSRERDTYCTIMNFAAHPERAWSPADYPAPELPDYDSFAVPVNKWLYDAEVRLFIKLAPKHLKIFVAGVFATGIRGGEFLFISRRAPDYADRNATGLNLDPGTEHFYLGWSKSKKPIFRTIPDWYVELLHRHLAARRDRHDALVLNDEGKPYKRPNRQKGFLVRTAWKSMRERVAAVIERLARRKARAAAKLKGEARAIAMRDVQRLKARAAVCRQVTPHWGRHNAASQQIMKGASDTAVDKSAGWQSPKMKKRYTHLSPEFAKDVANALDFGLGKRKAG
jgi:integrase